MNTVTSPHPEPVERQAGQPRRVILSGPAGERLGEVPLETCDPEARFPARDAAAQLLVATSPNWLDRPSTGDALHVVIGKRACFGYVADIDSVTWFSHPRLARADVFSSLPDREIRTLLYNLHSGDPDTVSEIIWETSGRITAHRAPALPAGIDPGARGLPERARDSAAYWKALGRVLADSALNGFANPCHGRKSIPRAGQPDIRGVVSARHWTGARVCPHRESRNSTTSPAVSSG